MFITSEELDRAGVAMIEHGYAPATVNRNISQIGSLYKWAARRRIVPVGFRSPTLGMVRTIKDRRFAVLIRFFDSFFQQSPIKVLGHCDQVQPNLFKHSSPIVALLLSVKFGRGVPRTVISI